MPENTIKIDFKSVVKIILFILLLVLLYFIRDIILLLIVSFVIASILCPIVDWFEKRKVSRFTATLLVYSVILLVFVGISILIMPSLNKEIEFLGQRISDYYLFLKSILGNFEKFLPSDVSQFQFWQGGLTTIGKGIFSFLGSVVGGIFAVFMMAVISFYFIVEKSAVNKFFTSFFSKEKQPFIHRLISLSQTNISNWGWGMLVLMILIGGLTYVGLLILDVRFALFLAIIAGLTEIIPRIGPFIGAVPAVILAFFQSPVKALLVVILYFIIQQVENVIVVPQVMKKAVGLNPLIVIAALLIGAKLGGVLGAIIAIPLAAIIDIALRKYQELKTSNKANNLDNN